jgi:hypothetical protein
MGAGFGVEILRLSLPDRLSMTGVAVAEDSRRRVAKACGATLR